MKKLFLIAILLLATQANAACANTTKPCIESQKTIAQFVDLSSGAVAARKYVQDAATAKNLCGVVDRSDEDFAECVNAMFAFLQGQK